jgi:DNA topoisomerase-2
MAEIKETLYMDPVTHALAKPTMYAGSKQLDTEDYHLAKIVKESDSKSLILYDKKSNIVASKALFKMVDETLTNIIDSFTRIKNKSCKKEIKINFVDETLTFINIGEGIPVHDVNVEGVLHPRPHVMLGILRSGTNLDENTERITGGTNGMGGKLVNLFSREYKLDTYDGKTYFKQTWTNNSRDFTGRVVEEKKLPDPYVRIIFTPDYGKFFPFTHDKVNLKEYLESRLLDTCLYLNFMKMNDVKVYYNGIQLEAPIDQFLDTFGTRILTFNPVVTHPYSITICYESKKTTLDTYSIINGINVPSGTHFDIVAKKIVDDTKSKIRAKYNEVIPSGKQIQTATISRYLSIIIIGNIANPTFDSQSKTRLDNPALDLRQHILDNKSLEIVYKAIEPLIERDFIKPLVEENEKEDDNLIPIEQLQSKMVTTKVPNSDDYEAAAIIHDKQRRNVPCTLIITEGLSALGMLKQMRNKGKIDKINLDPDTCGIFAIQGVTLNVRPYIRKNQFEKIIKIDPRILNNKKFMKMLQIIGLNFSYQYDTENEFTTLNYKRIDLAMDQDEDGKGNIRSLILQDFYTIWPKLFNRPGFINYWDSPILRFDYKGQTMSFISERKFENWVSEHKINLKNVKYIKGLGGHHVKYHDGLRRSYNEYLVNVYENPNEKKSREHNLDYIHIYFGNNSNLRKIALSTKKEFESYDFVDHTTKPFKSIELFQHFISDTNSFKAMTCRRMMPDIGGLNYAKRLVTYQALVNSPRNKEIYVSNLASSVRQDLDYKHGDSSLCDVIIGMASDYCGLHDFQIFKPVGLFANRIQGMDGASQPRYIEVIIDGKTADAIYPKDDLILLPYSRTNGQFLTPDYILPTIPMCIMDNFNNISNAWKINIYARDPYEVISYLKDAIKNGKKLINSDELIHQHSTVPINKLNEISTEYKLTSNTVMFNPAIYHDIKGESDFKVSRYKLAHNTDEKYSYGKYEIINDFTIKITELPITKTTNMILFGSSGGNNVEIPNMNQPQDLSVDKKKQKGKRPIKKKEQKDEKEIAKIGKSVGIDVTNIAKTKKQVKCIVRLPEYESHSDRSDGDTIDIIVKFNTSIREKHTNGELLRYLGLFKNLKPQLNLITTEGLPKNYQSYKSIFVDWFNARMDLYIKRVTFQYTENNIEIIRLQNMVRFIDEKLDKQLNEEAYNKYLTENNYKKINYPIKKYPNITIEEYKHIAFNPEKSNYNYLLDLTMRQKTEAYKLKLKQKIDDLEKENNYLKSYKKFKGDNIWLDEIKQFETNCLIARSANPNYK